jgi:hypothetical protein
MLSMLKPKVWFDALKLRGALKKYPVYSPPNMRNEIELPIGMAKENFNYFQTNLASRQTSFRTFMKTFAIDATTDDRGLVAVSEWFNRYGGLLLYYKPRSATTLRAFVNYDPPWIGRHIGINVVWDLGTYIGNCIIARRASAHWDLNTGDPDPMSCSALGFHRPQVAGLYWPTECDPVTKVFLDSQLLRHHVRLGPSPFFPRRNLVYLVDLWSKPNPPNPETERAY